MRLRNNLGLGNVGITGATIAAVTPLTIFGSTDLKLWLRSDLGVTLNGSTVSAWADQSGNGNNFSQGTALKQPTYTAMGGPGGKPGFDFVTNDTLTNVGFADASTSYALWAVFTQRGVSVDQQLFSGSGNVNLCELSQNAGHEVAFFSGAGRKVFGAATAAPQTLMWDMNGSTVEAYRNNVQLGTTQTRSAAAFITQAWIGSNQDVGGWANVILSEVILLKVASSAPRRTLVADYITARYGAL